jgi:hypothetical protein
VHQNGPLVEELPPGQGAPPAPMPSSAKRGYNPTYKTAGQAPRRSTTGTGAVTRNVSSGGTTASAQSGYGKPSAGAQPSLIGPLGYDDLK